MRNPIIIVCARLVLPAAFAVVMLLTACAGRKHPHQPGSAEIPVYDTVEKLHAMPRCKAVVVERGPCYVQLRTAQGEVFLIGSPAASLDLVQFLNELKETETYKFPETFQKYQDHQQRQRQP
jgi:hypothetical protein